MRNVIYLAVLLAAAPVAAQPDAESGSEPRTCQVTIARAPDDVRQVIETWVRTEPQCSIALEVRIVPTDGGLYLIAHDEQGRIRERIVPDAQTAGVLVASWIADDNAPPPAPAADPFSTRTPISAVAPVASSESISAPGMVPISIEAGVSASNGSRGKWLAVGALLPMTGTSAVGVRGELDAWRRGAWTIGAAASYAESSMDLYTATGWGSMSATDLKMTAYVARAWRFGRWQLRPSLGLGFIYAEGSGYISDPGTSIEVDGTFPTAEGSLFLSRELGKQWAAYGGPLATIIAQRFDEPYYSSTPMTVMRSDIDLALFAGVRHRL